MLQDQVAALMRSVAQQVILPRFRALARHEIVEKSPGELVTWADREAELRLHDGLDALGLGARIVGEEACSEDSSLLDDIGTGLIWLVDPLDGTANYAAGREPFGMMISLINDGQPLSSWMLDPASNRLCTAARGFGAKVNGCPIRSRASDSQRPVASLATQFMTPTHRARVEEAALRRFDLEPIPRCAAESYPRLVFGRNDVALFQRILPWDHAAGILFVEEAGGMARHWNGAPYRVGSDHQGLLVGANEAQWQAGAQAMFLTLQAIGAQEPLAA